MSATVGRHLSRSLSHSVCIGRASATRGHKQMQHSVWHEAGIPSTTSGGECVPEFALHNAPSSDHVACGNTSIHANPFGRRRSCGSARCTCQNLPSESCPPHATARRCQHLGRHLNRTWPPQRRWGIRAIHSRVQAHEQGGDTSVLGACFWTQSLLAGHHATVSTSTWACCLLVSTITSLYVPT